MKNMKIIASTALLITALSGNAQAGSLFADIVRPFNSGAADMMENVYNGARDNIPGFKRLDENITDDFRKSIGLNAHQPRNQPRRQTRRADRYYPQHQSNTRQARQHNNYYSQNQRDTRQVRQHNFKPTHRPTPFPMNNGHFVQGPFGPVFVQTRPFR